MTTKSNFTHSNECKANPKYPIHKGHFPQVVIIDHLHFIQCDFCGQQMVKLFNKGFLTHVSQDSLTRLAVALIEKPLLNKAELALVDYVKNEVF